MLEWAPAAGNIRQAAHRTADGQTLGVTGCYVGKPAQSAQADDRGDMAMRVWERRRGRRRHGEGVESQTGRDKQAHAKTKKEKGHIRNAGWPRWGELGSRSRMNLSRGPRACPQTSDDREEG